MVNRSGQPAKAAIYLDVELCCERAAETFGKPEREKWINSDYVNLSNALFRQTRVRISPNTLKRIFGKLKTDSDYYPQKATRDALARYLGYGDWEDFVKNEKQPDEGRLQQYQPGRVEVPAGTQAAALPSPGFPRVVFLAILLVVFAAALSWWIFKPSSDAEAVTVTCRNPTGGTPHSAIFRIHRKADLNSSAEKFTLLFGDGRKIAVNPRDSVYTHYYESPGRYFAILQRDGENIDTATIYLRTQGWTVTGDMLHDTTRMYPIDQNPIFSDGAMEVTALSAAHAGIDTNKTFFMRFTDSRETGIDGDNFELVTQVKTSGDRAGVRCSQVRLTVWGEQSQHVVDIMRPGCVYWSSLQASEVVKRGENDDLSFLGADLRKGGMLKMEVVDKLLCIYIDNRKIYETRYEKPLNQIYGVSLLFSGIGRADSFQLRDLRNGKFYSGNFEQKMIAGK